MRALWIGTICFALAVTSGCGGGANKKQRDFYTSGSREADQRAEQVVIKDQQLKGEGQNAGSEARGVGGAQKTEKPSLYQRLGGETGVVAIVDDYVERSLADPRVNWERKGVTRRKMLGLKSESVEWHPSEQNLANLKKHLVQFFSLATGGPTVYEGGEMKQVHEGMKISNAEFDANVGDLKATLDKLKIGIPEQKELLAVMESTRAQVVEQR